jgi:putative nucleotidyltransferase with HDIG domain
VENSDCFLFWQFFKFVPKKICQHSLLVARKASRGKGGNKRRLLFYAGLFHDIGKSEKLARIGFHPLDGARFMQQIREDDIAYLVARHTGASEEALALDISLAPWTEEREEMVDLERSLARADLTTSPKGEDISFAARILDVKKRYGIDSLEAQVMQETIDSLIISAQEKSCPP